MWSGNLSDERKLKLTQMFHEARQAASAKCDKDVSCARFKDMAATKFLFKYPRYIDQDREKSEDLPDRKRIFESDAVSGEPPVTMTERKPASCYA